MDKVADLEIERNKKKNREGRFKNLAQMYVDREIERGPMFASMWLYREFQIQGVDDFSEEFERLHPYIEDKRKESMAYV